MHDPADDLADEGDAAPTARLAALDVDPATVTLFRKGADGAWAAVE